MNVVMAWYAFAIISLGTGCGVTPMFNPPIIVNPTPEQEKVMEAQHTEIAEKLVGAWKASDDKAEAKITIGKEKLLLIDAKIKDGDNGMKPVALCGFCSYLDARPYLMFCADLSRPEYDAIGGMVRPNYYAAHLVFDGNDKVMVEIITWKTEGEHSVPTDPSLVFNTNGDKDKIGDTVMNTSAELCELIAAKKYRVAEVIAFERVK